jgi:predicted O-methyltransferase YrrM
LLNAEDIDGLLATHNVKGFLPTHEAAALFSVATTQARLGPILEIGSYCGRSAVYLGAAAQVASQVVFSVDHHTGSEEHQQGEGYFDAEHWDGVLKRVDTLPAMRRTLMCCAMEDVVIPVVARSEKLAAHWTTPLAMIFVDGGHSDSQAKADCLLWAKHLMPTGIMAIHDIFEKPEDGGQAPYHAMQAVMAEYGLVVIDRVDSLVFLQRAVD